MELRIEGMTCGHCVHAVTQALRGVAGARSAEVSLEKGWARVDGEVSLADVQAAVAEEGYKASLWKRA